MKSSLAQPSVALQHLETVDLDYQLRDSLESLSLLGRKASAEIRIRLLPMLEEVRRRYKAGETINKIKRYHEYLHSLGLTPSTVRSWQTRNHQRILGDVLKSTEKTKQIGKEEKKYERELKDGIDNDIRSAEWSREQEREEKEFQRRLKEDPEFRRQHEERERQYQEDLAKRLHEAKQRRTPEHQPQFNFSDFLHMEKNKPPAEDLREFASLGRREAARKYHPDRGGDSGRMAQLNSVADWIEALANVA